MAEKFIQHRIVKCKHLNVRAGASINSKVICVLDAGQTVQVVAESAKTVCEINASTKKSVEITWVKIKSNAARYWVSAAYAEAVPASAAKVVYGSVVEVGAQHKGGAKTLKDIIEKRITTCSTSASVYLQNIGCLNRGEIVSHTAAVKTDVLKKKKSVNAAIKGANKLKNGKLVYVGKNFKSLPAELKKAGIVYYQDSNVCVSAGGGFVFSTNESVSDGSGGQYKPGKGYYRTKVNCGYPVNSHIIYAFIPDIVANAN